LGLDLLPTPFFLADLRPWHAQKDIRAGKSRTSLNRIWRTFRWW